MEAFHYCKIFQTYKARKRNWNHKLFTPWSSGQSWVSWECASQEGLLWKRGNLWTSGLSVFSQYFLEVPYFEEKNTWQVRTTLRKEGIILETPLMNLLLKVKWYKKRKYGAQVETIIVSLFILYICSILIPRRQIWTGKVFTPSNPFLISSRSRWGDNGTLLTMYHVQL